VSEEDLVGEEEAMSEIGGPLVLRHASKRKSGTGTQEHRGAGANVSLAGRSQSRAGKAGIGILRGLLLRL
jgi:hypothetical protein